MDKLVPMGDQGVLAYFADESQAHSFASRVRDWNPDWLEDVVQAYTSVALFFPIELDSYPEILKQIRNIANSKSKPATDGSMHHIIPCCYEMQTDLERIGRYTGLPIEEIIRLHTSGTYTVYAIGFCPGFPYLGYLPNSLRGVPRLESPRVRVQAGSVGMTGKQTGIYTEPRPGGWNLIGRTPLQLVSVPDAYFPLRTGDTVRFESIDFATFEHLQGERLPIKERREPARFP